MTDESKDKHLPWEEEVELRIEGWHWELKRFANEDNLTAIERLKTTVEAQLAIAELKIKKRAADHAWMALWFPIIFPTLGAILGAFVGAWLKHP
jgi:hypothetical protein